MKIIVLMLTLLICLCGSAYSKEGDPIEGAELSQDSIFDDSALIKGYADKFANEPKEILLAMINDDSLGAYKTAAAIKIFKQQYAQEVLKNQKPAIVKLLIRRLNRSDSAFVDVEVMHTLVVLDRYQYFESMIPALIQKMDHYNRVVSVMAFDNLEEALKSSNRTREARVVFSTLRKILFLSRKRLARVEVPDQKLQQKISILKWAIKILGTQELKKLPKEAIGLL